MLHSRSFTTIKNNVKIGESARLVLDDGYMAITSPVQRIVLDPTGEIAEIVTSSGSVYKNAFLNKERKYYTATYNKLEVGFPAVIVCDGDIVRTSDVRGVRQNFIRGCHEFVTRNTIYEYKAA